MQLGGRPLRMRSKKVRQDAYNVDPSRAKFKQGKQNLALRRLVQRFKLSARERTARESREYAIGAAMGARTGGIWATLARGGEGNRLARAKSASAAPTLATTPALIGRTG
jgi:hypothetical protein